MAIPTPHHLFRAQVALATAAAVVATAPASLVVSHTGTSGPQPAHTVAAPPVPGKPTLTIVINLTASESSTAPAIDTAASTLGVADSNIYQLSQAGVIEDLDELQSMGVTSLRTLVPWMDIEPTKGTYNWTQMDFIVQQAAARGISIVATVSENPSWDGTVGIGAPNANAYASFAAAVASRYASQISAIEVMNEENSQGFNLGGSAATYTAVLKAAYTAIKAANPNITVIVGGLASVATNFMGQSPEKFLSQMLADGAAGYFDAIAYHPYNFETQFSAGASMAESAINQLTALRADLNAYGLSGVQIWATEYGEPTTPGIATTAQQAAYIANFVVQWNALAKTLNLGPAYLYTTRDISSGQLNDEDNYGLFYTDGTPKPAALVVAQLEYDLKNGLPLPSLASTLYTLTPGQQVAYVITELLEWTSAPLKLVQTAAQTILGSALSTVVALPPVRAALAVLTAIPPVKAALSAVASVLNSVGSLANTASTAVTAAAITGVIDTVNALVNPGKAVGPAVAAAVKAITTDAHNTQLTLAGAMKGTRATMAALGAAVAAALNPPKVSASTKAASTTSTPPAPASITTLPATARTPAAGTVTLSAAATTVSTRQHNPKQKAPAALAAATDASTNTGTHIKPTDHSRHGNAAAGTRPHTESQHGGRHRSGAASSNGHGK